MRPGENESKPLPAVSAQWRIEVQKRGKFFQWRRGSGSNRQARYGGKFELLTDERKMQYATNSKRKASPTSNGRRSPQPATVGSKLLPVGRAADTGGKRQRGVDVDDPRSVLLHERQGG